MADLNKLESLAGMTAETDAENPDPEQMREQAQQDEAASASEAGARSWGMLMYTAGGLVQMVAPELKPVYSEERCYQWGQHVQAVAEEYGWKEPKAMPVVALIVSTFGFVAPTYLVIRQKLQQAKAAKDGTLVEKMAAWWQHRKERRAAARAAATAAQGGEVVAEMRREGAAP